MWRIAIAAVEQRETKVRIRTRWISAVRGYTLFSASRYQPDYQGVIHFKTTRSSPWVYYITNTTCYLELVLFHAPRSEVLLVVCRSRCPACPRARARHPCTLQVSMTRTSLRYPHFLSFHFRRARTSSSPWHAQAGMPTPCDIRMTLDGRLRPS